MTNRQLFLHHVGQTSQNPLAFEVNKAIGCKLYDAQGKEYIDLIGGISVCNIGHGNEYVIDAIQKQANEYLHTMVYGEMVQAPQVQYAKMLSDFLPKGLNSVFFTASGSEATEGALKLAKRFTGRSNVFHFKNSYHGSTQGALSVMGSEYWQQAFRPLIPGSFCFDYNDNEILSSINHQTAAVIMECIQAEAGVNPAHKKWIQEIRKKCTEVGALLILDEIQTGFGRTGNLWGMQEYEIIPDILLLGKALGGGMPLGAFIADKKLMDYLSFNPVLGHINTFGGHPVCCAAGLAAFKYLIHENIIQKVPEKEQLFRENLISNGCISSRGLIMAIGFENFEINKKIIDTCIENGVFTDWFLFAPSSLRIAPPLTITNEEILKACDIINFSIKKVKSQ